MAIKPLTIRLQEDQLHKLDELRVKTGNLDVDIEFIAGLLLNTLLRDEPATIEIAERLMEPFIKK